MLVKGGGSEDRCCPRAAVDSTVLSCLPFHTLPKRPSALFFGFVLLVLLLLFFFCGSCL